MSLRNQLQVDRSTEAPFYFWSADFLERVGESPNAFVTARITADKEQSVLNDNRTAATEMDDLSCITLYRTIFVSSPSPHFDGVGVDEK